MGTHCIDTPHTLSQTYVSIGQISELVSEGPVINLLYDIVLITPEAYVLVANLVFFHLSFVQNRIQMAGIWVWSAQQFGSRFGSRFVYIFVM